MGVGVLRRHRRAVQVAQAAGIAEIEAPAKSASKGDWEAYAASLGVDIEGLTKGELQSAVDAPSEAVAEVEPEPATEADEAEEATDEPEPDSV